MAIIGSDGSITLSTNVELSGLKKGLNTIKTFVSNSGKAFAAIGLAATAAATAITKMAVSAYADYEQLIGGVETLFKGSAKKVIEFANDAYSTAGISANEYMQTVTSFSASLLSSLGGDTEKAADIANQALIDMSDNANKMGTAMESIQNAYQGFAKQQYQLLDNLKLGYGGTKTEMQRLLKDAQALTGVKYDISNLADVYKAIHVIQKELGITGTTAKEAEETISGSLNMTKAAWQNLVTAISGGGDLDKAIKNLVNSLDKFTSNIVPAIEKTLSGLGKAIQKILPQLIETVVSALIQSIPRIISTVYYMIIGIFKGLVAGIQALFFGGTANSTAKLNNNIKNMATNADATADNMNDVADATEKAGKEAKKAIAGFDDLQILTSGLLNNTDDFANSISNFGNSIDNSGVIFDFSTAGESPDASWLDAFLEKLEPARVALERLWLQLQPLQEFTSQSLQDFYNMFLVPIGDWVLNESFPILVDSISGRLALVDWEKLNGALGDLWTALEPMAENIGEGLLWFWEEVIMPLIGWSVNNLIPAALDLISQAVKFLDEIIKAAKPALVWFWNTFMVPIRDYIWGKIIDFINLLTKAFENLTDWAKNNKETVSEISKLVLEFLAGIWVYNTTKKLIDFVKVLGKTFVTFGNALAEGGYKGAFFAAAVGILFAAIITLSQNWDKMTPAQQAITILGALAAAATAAAIAIAIFHTAWSVGIAAATIAGGLAILGLTFAFTDTGTAGNAAVDAADNFYSSYNWDKPLKLPALAKGGIVPHATTALIGEAGKEAVLPLENNTEWMDILAEKIASRGGNGNIVREEHYYINQTELMNIIYKLAKQGERENGKDLLKGW